MPEKYFKNKVKKNLGTADKFCIFAIESVK